ncbi:lysophospholipid acyltransferase family protein [bacterium]|nr:lysophospholipid acyltransferase family protein [bacterium]
MRIHGIFKSGIIPWLAWILIRSIGRSIIFETKGEENYLGLKRKDKNIIFAIWHSRLFLTSYYYRYRLGKKNACILISSSKDGEFITKVIEKFGYSAIRGSSRHYKKNTHKEMLKKLSEGFDMGITPDGPRGPSEKVQQGVIHIAAESGCPIVPITFSSSRSTRLNSWDRFVLPRPFTKAVVTFGLPIYVPSDASKEESLKKGRELEDVLNRITKMADKHFNMEGIDND